MTLNTSIYVHDPVELRQVFVKCNQLLGAHEGIKCREYRGGLMNEPGQDLGAWLAITSRPGRVGGLTWTVSFETAYGYQGPEGGCGDLHVRLIRQLGAWLDGRGVRWSWKNEFTGDIYDGTDGLDTLGTWTGDDERARDL